MRINAAVVREINHLTIEEIEMAPPHERQVLVKVKAAGVCHSDLHTYKGELRSVPPIVLGHEGAGIIEEVGPGVTKFKAGDPVIINWLPGCLTCNTCMSGRANLCERLPGTTFQSLMPDGTTHHTTLDGMVLKPYLSSATMADYAIVDEDGLIPIPDDMPFDVAAVIGCAVLTGAGAVLNTAQAESGSSAMVIGCGGVGLSAVQGCQLAGCYPLIAVDVMDSKLDFARELGATHTVNAKDEDAVKAVKKLTKGGPDYAFDSVGASATITQALTSIRPGGTAVVMGLHSAKDDVPVSAAQLILMNKSLLGSFAGSANPQVDLPKLVKLYQGGRLQLDKLISKHYALDELPQAFADMEAGNVARGVITF